MFLEIFFQKPWICFEKHVESWQKHVKTNCGNLLRGVILLHHLFCVLNKVKLLPVSNYHVSLKCIHLSFRDYFLGCVVLEFARTILLILSSFQEEKYKIVTVVLATVAAIFLIIILVLIATRR